ESIEVLRHFLRQHLPDYMLPSAFVLLSALPLTPSGKVNTKALPAPAQVRDETDTSYVSPRDAIELQLVQIWQDLLQRTFIGTADNFFDLGGHSLLAVRMVEQIHERLGVQIPLALIFKQATIASLASQLRQQGEPLYRSALVEFRSQGTRPPFFCIHPVGGEVFCYLDLARLLDQDQPFYALQSLEVGIEQTEPVPIEEMASSYIEAIQRISAGPYYLGGWSLGGVIAFEIAQQLQKQGQEVKLLALMDSYVPAQLSSTGDIMTDLIQDLNGLFGKDISLTLPDLHQINTREQINLIFNYAEKSGILLPGIGEAYKQRMFSTFKNNMLAFRRYNPQVYPGKLTIFQAGDQETKEHISSASGWRSLTTQEIRLHTLPGDHYTMMKQPHIKMLARYLSDYLAE
ncbi:MAG TPA: thioesterase domain-containing protein, partial [Ktedonobacteraceae bacterium]|nr:thioesterase domain-containing protein [Ktedonobacteraceae bacterium]